MAMPFDDGEGRVQEEPEKQVAQLAEPAPIAADNFAIFQIQPIQVALVPRR